MKKFVVLVTAATIATGASAQDISVFVNGEPVRFVGVGPRQVNGRVMVPLRGVMERLGAFVGYQPATKTITALRGDVDLQLTLGQRVGRLNGREVTLDVPAQSFGGTTLVPLRFMSETLGAEVLWEASTRSVRINTSDAEGPAQIVQPPAGGFDIRSFDMDKAGNLKAGDRVTFTLEGTPGGTAVMQIPGLTGQVPMREVSAGRYEAVVEVPKNVPTVNRATAVARLTYNGQERFIQAGRRVTVDMQAPVIAQVTPEDKSRVTTNQPNVSFTFDDVDGTGVVQEQVKLFLNDKDVTSEATITGSMLFFRPKQALPVGNHKLRAQVQDGGGNRTTLDWTFTVANTKSPIDAFTHNGAKGISTGQNLRFELSGTPGSEVTFSVGEIISGVKAREVSPGRYVGTYGLKADEDVSGLPVTAHLKTKEGQVYTLRATEAIGGIRPPAKPTIVDPTANRVANSNTINIRGKAPRRSKVHIVVQYNSTLLGIIGQKGTLLEKTVVADNSGNWSTGDFRIDGVGIGSGTTYTVTAKTISANGVESQAATVSFKR